MKPDAVSTGSTVRGLAEPPEFLQRDNPRLKGEPFEILAYEIVPWNDHNFPGWRNTPYRLVLGMTEELGELAEAIQANSPDDVEDAIGDIVVYTAVYCASQERSIVSFSVPAIGGPKVPTLVREYMLECTAFMGKIAHGRLKTEQGIRGTPDKHWAATESAINGLLCRLSFICNEFDLTLPQVVAKTWGKVRRRDWQLDRLKGVAGSA